MALVRPVTRLKSGPATLSGSAEVMIGGSGVMQAQPATLSGQGAREIVAAGAMVAQAATLSGVGSAGVIGPFAIDAVLQTTNFSGVTIFETSKDTIALFQVQTWNVLGRYTWEAYGLDSRISLIELAGGNWDWANISAPSGVYPYNARVWDNVSGSIVYDTISDGTVNPQVTIP